MSVLQQAMFMSAGGLDSYTKILLHFDGTNGSTTFTDKAKPSRTWTPRGSGATISTSAGKFAQSLTCGTFTGYIDTPDDVDFTLGSGAFTFDMWFDCRGGGFGGSVRNLFGQCDASQTLSTYACSLRLGTDDKLAVTACIGSTNFNCFSTGTAPASTGFHHAAVVRTGNNLMVALDGVFGTPVALTAGGSINNASNKFAIGNNGEYVSTPAYWNGYIDEFRLSVGIARWTSNFNGALPTSPYG